MTRRELLQDRYEDALFALLMDDVATAEGKRAAVENERLKNDPSAEIPAGMEMRSLQTIRRCFAWRDLYSVGRFTVKAMKRVVMAAGVAAILFTGAFAASETVRLNTLNLIIEVFDTTTTFRFVDQPVETESLSLEVGWLPEGYVLESQGQDETSMWYQYQKSENESFHIDYMLTLGAGVGVDTEDAKTKDIEVQGTKAMLAEKENEVRVVWTIKDGTALIGIVGEGIDRDDLLRVANGLKY